MLNNKNIIIKKGGHMKSKKLTRKLALNKSTVANLAMKEVKGGCYPSLHPSCQSVTCLSDYIFCCIEETTECTMALC